MSHADFINICHQQTEDFKDTLTFLALVVWKHTVEQEVLQPLYQSRLKVTVSNAPLTALWKLNKKSFQYQL